MTSIPATSRQWLVVPGALLTARPLQDPVDLAVMPGGSASAEPATGDWRAATWLAQAGVMLGAGLLLGPGTPAALPAGTYRILVRENLPTGVVPVWVFTRLTIGTGP